MRPRGRGQIGMFLRWDRRRGHRDRDPPSSDCRRSGPPRSPRRWCTSRRRSDKTSCSATPGCSQWGRRPSSVRAPTPRRSWHFTWHVDGSLALLGAVVVSGVCGGLVGIPALRLGGDYLFLVSLGFNLIFVDVANNRCRSPAAPPASPASRCLSLFGDNVGRGRSLYFAVFAIVVIVLLIVQTIQSEPLRSNDAGDPGRRRRRDVGRRPSVGAEDRLRRDWFGAHGAQRCPARLQPAFRRAGVVRRESGACSSSRWPSSGDSGRTTGSVVWRAFIIILLPEVFRPLQDYRMMITGVIIILLMAFRPQGLPRQDEDHQPDQEIGRRR